MKRFISRIALALLVATSGTFSSAQPAAAWQTLFNGQNFDGWSFVDPPLNAVVEDGNMLIHMTPHSARHAFIRTQARYEDFIFEIEFQRDQAMDSGVLFRSEAAPETAFSGLFGYMVKLDPQAQRRWTGGVFVDFGNGYNWLHTLEDDARARAAEKPPLEWNHLRIEAIGENIRIWLNGVPTVHMQDDRYTAGYIALKIHYLNNGDTANRDLKIAYRHARIIADRPERFSTPIDLPLQVTSADREITFFR